MRCFLKNGSKTSQGTFLRDNELNEVKKQHQNVYNADKLILRWKWMAINAYIRKERSQIRN